MTDVFLLSSFGTVWSFVNAATDARGKEKSVVMAERRCRKMAAKHWIWHVSDMLLVVFIAKFGCVENKTVSEEIYFMTQNLLQR